MTKHVLEKLAETNSDAEIWWDSSPLVYPSWKQETLAAAPDGMAGEWDEQLTRLYDPDEPAEMGFRGVTTNPPLSLQAVQLDPEGWRKLVKDIATDNPSLDVEGVYWKMYLHLVKVGADTIRPLFENSGYKYGMLSGQVDPRFVTDGDAMLEQGLSIAAMGDNVMVKLPGSKEGYEVLEELTARGISTNNTTAFTVAQYVRCRAAVSAGLLRARAAGVDLSKWRSVITHMASRLGEKSDWKKQAEQRGIDLSMDEIRDGEEAVLKRAYWHGKEINHPSKMLQCSLRIEKNEEGRTVTRQLQDFAGSDMVYTCPPGYIKQLMEVEDELAPFDPKAIEREPDTASIEKLMKLPAFRQAYEYEGMKPEEFTQFGSFQITAMEFAAATRQTVDFVRMVLDD